MFLFKPLLLIGIALYHACYPCRRMTSYLFVDKTSFEMDKGAVHAARSRLFKFIVTSNLLFAGFTNTTANTARTTPENVLQANGVAVQNFISHGTLWHIHINAFVYHLLDDSPTRDAGASPSGFTLTGLIQTWSTVTLKKQNPCKNMIFGGNYSKQYESIRHVAHQNIYQFLEKWQSRIYNFQIKSFICGSISSDIVSQSMAYSWSIHVHSRFKLNVTVTRLEVNYFLGCAEIRAELFDFLEGYDGYILGHHCPNAVPQSFFSTGHAVILSVYILRDYISALSAPRTNLAHLEFQYHVLDQNFEVFVEHTSFRARTISTVNPVFRQREAVVRNDMYPDQSVISFKMAMSPGDMPDMSIGPKKSNGSEGNWQSFNHTITRPLPRAELMETVHFDSFQLHVIYIQAPLGMTVSVSSGSLFCQTDEGKVVFYDGPPLDILHADSRMVRLAEWHCQMVANLSQTHTDYTKGHEKFQANIGDLTLMIIWNASLLAMASPKVKLDIDIELSGTESIQYQSIFLQRNETIEVLLDPNTSSICVLNISSTQFIQIVMAALSYKGYFGEFCHSGGIFIFSDSKHVGSICSQLTAELMVNHYHKQGMRLGAFVQIVIKQYIQLSRITARFHFNKSECLGYLNLVANKAFETGEYSIIRGAQVRRFPVYYDFPLALDVKYKTKFWDDGVALYQSVQEYWETLHIKREAGYCLCIQIVYFDHITYGPSPKSMLYLSSVDKREYSRFKVILSYFPRLEDSFFCEDAFRLHLDTKANYINISAQHPDNANIVPAEAYNTKIHIPLNCLWKGLAFTVQLRGIEKDASQECFFEFGKYLYDLVQPITPSGICGSIYLVPQLPNKDFAWEVAKVSFQKPINVYSCCFYNLVVTISGETECGYYGILVMPDFLHNSFPQWEWNLLNTTAPLLWQGNCFRMSPYRECFLGLAIFDTCLDVEIYTWNRPSSCKIELSFSTSLHTFSKPGKLTQNDTMQERSLCSEEVCYVSPAVTVNMTWNEARNVCEGKGGHLASINSDEEWAFLTGHHLERSGLSTLLHLMIAPIYFMGLRGQASTLNVKICNMGTKLSRLKTYSVT